MPRLHHVNDHPTHPGSRARHLVGGLRRRIRTAVVRGSLGPVEPDSAIGSPVLRSYPYRVDR